MKSVNQEDNLLIIQIVITSLFIGCLCISLLLMYNELLEDQNKEPILSNDQANTIAIINRSLLVILTLSFLYVNYQARNIDINNNIDCSFDNLQIVASELTVLASIIALYVAVKTNSSFFPDIEDPEI